MWFIGYENYIFLQPKVFWGDFYNVSKSLCILLAPKFYRSVEILEYENSSFARIFWIKNFPDNRQKSEKCHEDYYIE